MAVERAAITFAWVAGTMGAWLAACSGMLASPSRGEPADADTGSDATEDAQVDAPAADTLEELMPVCVEAGPPSDACIADAGQPAIFHPPACEATNQHAAWTKMDQQPILPPGGAGGIDFAKACALTIGEAEKTLCQGMYLGDLMGDCSVSYGWGPNLEVVAAADRMTGVIQRLDLNGPGYDGGISFVSPDGGASYFIGLNGPVQKDGQTFSFTADSQVDEMYRGLIATFAPQIGQAPPGVTCMATHECLAGSFGDVRYFYVPALGLALWIANANVQGPGVNRILLSLPK